MSLPCQLFPHRQAPPAPLLPQGLVSPTVWLLLTCWKPAPLKAIRPSALVGGNGIEKQAFGAVRWWPHETYQSPKQGRPTGVGGLPGETVTWWVYVSRAPRFRCCRYDRVPMPNRAKKVEMRQMLEDHSGLDNGHVSGEALGAHNCRISNMLHKTCAPPHTPLGSCQALGGERMEKHTWRNWMSLP